MRIREIENKIHLKIWMYNFFAINLLKMPSKEIFQNLLEDDEIRRFKEIKTKEAKLFVRQLQKIKSYKSEEWIKLQEEYSALFEGTRGFNLPLWESVYKGSENILLDENTLKVQQYYKAWGIGVTKDIKQPCDHIGLEFSFLAWINKSMLKTLKENNIDEFKNHIEGQLEFLNKHVLTFLPSFCERLREKASHDFYKEMSHFLLEYIEKEINSLSEMKAIEQLNNDTIHMEIGVENEKQIGLYELDEYERKYEEKMQIVSTSGRNNCGGRCIIKAHVNGGNIIKLTTDTEEESDRGPQIRACVRGRGYRKTFLSPDRLRYPMKRVGERGEGKFKRISWEEAVDTIASEFQRIKKEYGPESRYVNYSTGVSAVLRGDRLSRRLLALDGGYLGYYNDYSTACIKYTTPYTYGTIYAGNSTKDLVNSKLIILWGHNPAETIFDPLMGYYLKKAKEAGAKIIVVDPRYSDTAAGFGDEWIGLKPTTDSALMDAMAYVILSENLQNQEFMDKYCLGFDKDHMPDGVDQEESYYSYVFGEQDGIPKTPEWAEKITGVDTETIYNLACEYATTKPAAIVQGYGPQRNSNGEQTIRSSTMLACLTGNVGIKGGSAAGATYVKQHEEPELDVLTNPYKAKIPTFLWTDAIIRGTEMTSKNDGVQGADKLKSNIKMIINLAGNTLINQHSDINRTIEILKDTSKCEFIVCSDLFMTPSAKFADMLLPGTSMFEGVNITTPWSQGDYIMYNNQAIDPLFEGRFEYDWLKEVAEKMGLKEKFTDGHETVEEWMKSIYEETKDKEPELPTFEEFTKRGVYKYKPKESYIAFKEQIEDFDNNPFPTPSGKIEIFSKRLYDLKNPKEIPAIPKYIDIFEGLSDPKREVFPLQMIGWHTKRRCHSTHDNNDWMEEIELHKMWINPIDAKLRNIKEGDLVEIWNDRGIIQIPAHVTQRIVKGVIAVAQGAWYTPNKNGIDIRGSINTITTSRPTPLAKGNPQHSNLVEVKAVEKEG